MILTHDDNRLSWHGHISLERTATYTRPWRIPFAKRNLFHSSLRSKASMPAGVRLAFHTDSTVIHGNILPCEINLKLDLFVDGRFIASEDLAGKSNFAFDNLPSGEKLVELWLPPKSDFALTQLEVEDGSTVRPFHDTRLSWVTYGSSLTHCVAAESPSQTWPSIVARAWNLNLTGLGFGGQCHLDMLMAQTMRDLKADYFSICAGANVYGNGSLNSRSFLWTLIGFVQILREKHPEAPIALISPIHGVHRETTPTKTGLTLQDYRAGVHEAAEILKQHGDINIHYVDGRNLFDSSMEHLMPDKLHPDAEGYKRMGENFLKVAAPVLFAKKPATS